MRAAGGVVSASQRYERRIEPWLVLALGFAALTLGLASLSLRPDLHRSAAAILFGDQGYNLWVAERLLAGDRLHMDVAYQYGALSAYLHTAVAAVFGNTVSSFHGFFLGVSVLNVMVAAALVRQVASRTATLVVVGLGLTATMLVPGSLLGGTTNSTYVPLERLLILLAALAWAPPWGRSIRRAVLLGLVIGGWQWVRFGGGFFLALALVGTDLLALFASRRWGAGWRRSLRILAITAGVAAMVELLRATVAFATLPGPIARDVVWPAYVLESYGWVTAEVRWPTWGGWKLLLGQYLTPLIGAASGAILIAESARGTRHGSSTLSAHPSRTRLVLPLIFFLVAGLGMFKMAYHFLQFAWTLVLPAALVFDRAGRLIRWGLVLLFLPCFLVNVRSYLATRPAPDQAAFRTPRGELLWAPAEVRRELGGLMSLLEAERWRADPATTSAMIIPLAAGLHYAYDVRTPLRQSWFLPGFVRPYDEPEIREALPRLDVVIVRDAAEGVVPSRPCSWRDPSPFDEELCTELASNLGEGIEVGRFLVFPVTASHIDQERTP